MSRIAGLAAKVVMAICATIALSMHTASAANQKLTVLYNFVKGKDGGPPIGGVIYDNAGNFYGATIGGGAAPCDCGVVYKLAPNGKEVVLHSFAGGSSDGAAPNGGLVEDSAGNLYGMTEQGGNNTCGNPCGTVYKVAPDGTETMLHSFSGNDGYHPSGALILDQAGNLYGTTALGGTSQQCSSGCGTIFKLAPDGTETVLYSFVGGSDGSIPSGALLMDTNGNLYGSTMAGGGSGCFENSGCGTIFELSAAGTETILYSFKGGNDGDAPIAPITMDSSGNIYGATAWGNGTGCANGLGCGTVFKLAPDGIETVMYGFTGQSDGGVPSAGVISDQQGNLYGATILGGDTSCPSPQGGAGCGTIFKVTPSGVETVLHTFQKPKHGAVTASPNGLIADTAGHLYGTTTYARRYGMVFELNQ